MKTLIDHGNYTVKETGEQRQYEFDYVQYESIEDVVNSLGEEKALRTINRMVKVDANNTARESAKTKNGHSTRKVLSEEEKLAKKAQRQADKALLDKIKSLSPEQLAELGIG